MKGKERDYFCIPALIPQTGAQQRRGSGALNAHGSGAEIHRLGADDKCCLNLRNNDILEKSVAVTTAGWSVAPPR